VTLHCFLTVDLADMAEQHNTYKRVARVRLGDSTMLSSYKRTTRG
jgi:hypothetical protein